MPRSARTHSRRAPMLAAAALALTLGATACGSASNNNAKTSNPVGQGATKSGLTTSTTATGATTTAPAGATTTAPGGAGATTPASTPSTGLAEGPVPAVTGATNLSAAPAIAAGTGTPPTVLTGKDLVVGTGPAATASTANVTVQYVGTIFQTGEVFDSSWTRGQPASFPLNGVVPGFRDAIIGMKVGGRREVVIPPAQGYGSQANGPIPANSTLVFVVDLVSLGS